MSVILQSKKQGDFILTDYDLENIVSCSIKLNEEDNIESKKNKRDYQRNILDSYDGKAKEHFSMDKDEKNIAWQKRKRKEWENGIIKKES